MILALLALALQEEGWSQFRGGPAGGLDGRAELAEAWSRTEGVAWTARIPGHGWSSPVVRDGKVFVTSFVGPDPVTAPKTGYYAPKATGAPKGEHRWTVYCLDAADGKLLWERPLHRAEPRHPIHVKSSYAAETPATDGERLFVLFGNVGLYCLDLEGNPLWAKEWSPKPTRLDWGAGSSPALHGGRVYVLDDNEADSSLAAYEAATGKELWRVARDEKTSWATPFVWENGTRTEIVTVATGAVRSYGPDGSLLWSLGGMSSICIPTPIAAHGLLFINSGYEFGRPRPLLAVRPGGSGDLSLREGERSNGHVAWSLEPAGSYHPSPLVVGDHLYVLYSTGFVASFDARTGAEAWGRRRLEGTFTASPWSDGKRVYCLNEQGTTFVLPAGPEFKVLRKNDLGEMAMATPATAGGRTYLRTLSTLWCLAR